MNILRNLYSTTSKQALYQKNILFLKGMNRVSEILLTTLIIKLMKNSVLN